MKLNRTVAVAAVVAALAGAATPLAGVVSAHPGAGDGLVERIATRFNLNQDEVQQVVDEVRSEHRAEHQARFEERLNEAVEDGTLTAEQKKLVEGKMTEMESFVESLKDKTPEERREAMKEKHDELRAWAEDHDLPLGKFMKMGFRGPGMPIGNHK